MKIYIQNFRTLRKELKCIFWLSLIIIILAEFFVFRNQFLKSFANILVKLSYSYISALIFYYLVVHFKRQNEKRKFYPILNIRLKNISHHESIIENALIESSQNQKFNKLDLLDLRKELSFIKPYDPFLGMDYAGLGELAWMNHLRNVANKTRHEINVV